MPPSTLAAVTIIVALVFDFLNGFHDSSNIVATMISSRAIAPRRALLLAAVAEFAGPFLFGTAVAVTIGKDLVRPGAVTTTIILAALSSAVLWDILTWLLGLPSSSSHALVGGLLGAVGLAYGVDAVEIGGLVKVLGSLVLSPLLGLAAGWVLMKVVLALATGASLKINWFFKRSQVLTSLALAFSHGSNDAQKTMGIITLALASIGMLKEFVVPWWVVALCAGAISFGVLLGGWRIIATLGARMYRIRPVDGFTVQVASASVILGAALLGGPVSTTQVVSSAIMGVGSAERISKVRWGVAGEIVRAWLFTLPVCAVTAALIYVPLRSFLGG